MDETNQFFKEKIEKIGGSTLVSPNISEKFLSNAIKPFKYDGEPSAIIAIFDSTILKNAKEEILLTGGKNFL